MTSGNLIPTAVLKRKAVVYVRQSTQAQVQLNLESQRRQYELVDVARRWGFRKVEVIDEDLGRTASGAVERPGFERLVDDLCTGHVGAVLCLEASRLSRNGPDWHRLLELCGEVDARVIDLDGVYDPGLPNDRLLLGMKGSISEFELGVLRARMYEAARAKAQRGELRISVPFGYVWHRDYGLGFDPDMRLQETIRLIFARFRELGSARQVLISMIDDGVHFPRPSDGKKMVSFDWVPIRYRNVISILKNPFYAGAYVYGKSEKRTEIVDGRVRKSYGHYKPASEWAVVLKDHHEGYIGWSEYERNQELLAANAYGKAGGVKSGRGGRALLPGLISCGRCGRRLVVMYAGRGQGYPVYRCERGNLMMAQARCMSFNGFRTDAAVTREALEAVAPMAIEAALEAERMQLESEAKRRQMIELDLQQARYEASLAERRYAACDPENRLIAAQLERSWEATLRRVETCEARLSEVQRVEPVDAVPDFTGLAQDLEATWNAPGVDMRCRQQLLRALIKDIVADVDDDARDVILTIHWHGGQHSQVRVRKPKSGEHGQRTPEEALAIMRSMATRWSDAELAATLNRMGMQTGQGKTWTARRVQSLRTVHKISGYRSSDKHGEWLTMSDAAARLGVSHVKIRRFIRDGLLPAEQVMRGAPYQIRASDLEDERIKADLARNTPRRIHDENQESLFSAI
ncbi:recombinase family protein [Mesorhizobium sp. M0578]|uniref:recombinase family protein n=1 Tax=unclassified Mesorhizobium TaxID=325217 RepID=UPI00333D8511